MKGVLDDILSYKHEVSSTNIRLLQTGEGRYDLPLLFRMVLLLCELEEHQPGVMQT